MVIMIIVVTTVILQMITRSRTRTR
jgi:hypothetical protein